jgi:hypothetical protein
MPVLNFKKRFADDVKSGLKCQTIRALRKDGRNPKSGQTLYLYTGLRTKGCEKLREVLCKNVTALHIGEHFTVVKGVYAFEPSEIETFARADGFMNGNEFFDFFKKEHGLPFYGLLIEW